MKVSVVFAAICALTSYVAAEDTFKIKAFQVKDLKLSLSESSPWNGKASSQSIRMTYEPPAGMQGPFKFKDASFNLDFSINGGAGGSLPFSGSTKSIMDAPDMPNSIDISVDGASISIPQQTAYNPAQMMLKAFTQQDNQVFDVKGTIKVNAAAGAAGTALSMDVPVNVPSSLKGMQGLNAQPLVVKNLRIVGGTPTAMSVALETEVFNPSSITLETKGATKLVLAAPPGPNAADLGNLIVHDLTLNPGKNTIKTDLVYAPTNKEASTQFLSDYLANKQVPITIHGAADSTKISLLQQAIQSLAIKSSFSANIDKIVMKTETYGISMLGLSAKARIFGKNPLDTDLVITKLANVDILYKGTVIANVNKFTLPTPIHAGPKSDFKSEAPVKLVLSATLASLLNAKDINIDLNMKIEGYVGGDASKGYFVAPMIAQKDIPNSMDWSLALAEMKH
ncbi:hypothetical protein GQ42DRAFT_62548 [Ramicandelaber brevisporus]|nr:hypothetical protein GQ42DRAFT_62548 [Ramicandelaber brevisporus]